MSTPINDISDKYRKEILNILNSIAPQKSRSEVFLDWVKCSALAIANTCDIFRGRRWEQREKEYEAIASLYGNEAKELANAFALLTLIFDTGISDYLGEIYMDIGRASRDKGQFFTPFHISEMCSQIAADDELLKGDKPISMHEPSCGSGSMILAQAKTLKEKGVNYQKRMRVVAQDIEWRTVYMCYVQLSLCGINAIVVQGDTLREPEWRSRPPEAIFETPARCGVI